MRSPSAVLPETTRSTRRLSEVARHVVIPSGIVTTGWPEVEARAAEFGDEFDEWQRGLGQLILGKRADGIYAATVGGVVLSIPRQVAKTFIVGRTVFILCTLFPGLKVVWTAHRTRTSTQTFKTLQTYAKRPAVAPYMADDRTNGIRKTNGEQEIEFANKSIIMFGAREGGFGRGFDEVDIEVFDEAQILTEKALEDMVAATNQSRHPHGALLFYMGTPPRPVDPGEAFTLQRSDSLAFRPDGAAFGDPAVGEDTVFVECSADDDADPDDRSQWAKANASFPHRTPVRSMLRLRKHLPSVDSWRREALGIWDAVDNDDEVIGLKQWSLLTDAESIAVDGTVRLALDAALDRRSAVFSIAGNRIDGLAHVSVRHRVNSDGGLVRDQVIAQALRWQERYSTPLVLPPSSPAKAWRTELIAAGVELDELSAAEFAEGCGLMLSLVDDGAIRHRGQADMTEAVAGLAVKPSGDVDVWSARKSSVNIAPFRAATCALMRVAKAIEAPSEPVFVTT